jgi:NADH:ubiquinone oxidoreductase subunit C
MQLLKFNSGLQSVLIRGDCLLLYILHIRYSSFFKSKSLSCIFATDILRNRVMLCYCFSGNNDNIFLLSTVVSSNLMAISSIYFNASWYEREVHEMFGVDFLNSKDMRCLLLPFNFYGNPMKKNWGISYGITLVNNTQLNSTITY